MLGTRASLRGTRTGTEGSRVNATTPSGLPFPRALFMGRDRRPGVRPPPADGFLPGLRRQFVDVAAGDNPVENAVGQRLDETAAELADLIVDADDPRFGKNAIREFEKDDVVGAVITRAAHPEPVSRDIRHDHMIPHRRPVAPRYRPQMQETPRGGTPFNRRLIALFVYHG